MYLNVSHAAYKSRKWDGTAGRVFFLSRPSRYIFSIKPVKNKSQNHTKLYIGYGVITHSEKHGQIRKKFLDTMAPKMTPKI